MKAINFSLFESQRVEYLKINEYANKYVHLQREGQD